MKNSIPSGTTNSTGEVSLIEHYLESAASASRRSRFIVIVLLTASVLAFMALWNSLPWSWNQVRLNNLEDIIFYWPLNSEVEKRLSENIDRRDELARFREIQALVEGAGHHPETASRSEKEAFRWNTELQLYHLRSIRTERIVNVDIPIAGASFDINDLALFSGITFLPILLLLRYSLSRECQNLSLFGEIAGSKLTWPVYNLLATRQFLTVPPLKNANGLDPELVDIASVRQKYLSPLGSRERAIWRIMPKFLVWIPVLITSAVVINDYATFDIGANLSMTRAKVSIFLSVALLVLLVGVAASAYQMWRRIDRVWKELHEEASSLQS